MIAMAQQLRSKQRSAPQRILHPTRFSEADWAALDIACALARDASAELIVAHVADARRLYGSRGYRGEIERLLAAICRSRSEVCLSTLIATGDPASEIVGLCHDLRCDLLVMRPSAPGWLRGRVVESLSQRVKRLAPCTVISLEKDWLTHAGANGDCEFDGGCEPTFAGTEPQRLSDRVG